MLIGHSAPSTVEKAKEMVEAIAMEISFNGQTKQETYDDAKIIAEYCCHQIIKHVPNYPYSKASTMKDDARRYFNSVILQIKKIKV